MLFRSPEIMLTASTAITVGAGALIGSQVSLHVGLRHIGLVGGVLALAAGLWWLRTMHRHAASFRVDTRPR